MTHGSPVFKGSRSASDRPHPEAGAVDPGSPADGTAAGRPDPTPLGEGKVAGGAPRRLHLEPFLPAQAPFHMDEVAEDIAFREAQGLRDIPDRVPPQDEDVQYSLPPGPLHVCAAHRGETPPGREARLAMLRARSPNTRAWNGKTRYQYSLPQSPLG